MSLASEAYVHHLFPYISVAVIRLRLVSWEGLEYQHRVSGIGSIYTWFFPGEIAPCFVGILVYLAAYPLISVLRLGAQKQGQQSPYAYRDDFQGHTADFQQTVKAALFKKLAKGVGFPERTCAGIVHEPRAVVCSAVSAGAEG